VERGNRQTKQLPGAAELWGTVNFGKPRISTVGFFGPDGHFGPHKDKRNYCHETRFLGSHIPTMFLWTGPDSSWGELQREGRRRKTVEGREAKEREDDRGKRSMRRDICYRSYLIAGLTDAVWAPRARPPSIIFTEIPNQAWPPTGSCSRCLPAPLCCRWPILPRTTEGILKDVHDITMTHRLVMYTYIRSAYCLRWTVFSRRHISVSAGCLHVACLIFLQPPRRLRLPGGSKARELRGRVLWGILAKGTKNDISSWSKKH